MRWLAFSLLVFSCVNAVKIGVIVPPKSQPVQRIFEGVVSPFNGSRPSSDGDIKVGSFFAEVANNDVFSVTRELCNQLRHQVTSVVVSSPLTSKVLQGLFKNTNVNYLTTSYQDHCRSDLVSSARRYTPPSDKLSLSLMPDVIPAIADTIEHFQWSSFIFLYDSDSGTQKWQRLMSHKYKTGPVTMRYVKRVTATKEANDFLKAVDHADRDSNKYVVLDVPFVKAKEIIIQHARDSHVGKRNFHFLLAHPIANELAQQTVPEFSIVNITVLKLTGTGDAFRGFFDRLGRGGDQSQWADITEEKLTVEQALIHDAGQVLVSTYKELKNKQILRKHPDIFEAFLRIDNPPAEGATCDVEKISAALEVGDVIGRHMKEQSLQGLSGRVEFNQDGCRKNYAVDVLRLTKDSRLVKLAQWEYGKGFAKVSPQVNRQKEHKINHHRTYVISTILEEPFLFEKELDPEVFYADPNSKFQGYLKDLADEFATLVGFRYEFRVTKDGEMGSQSSGRPGGWGGIVGDILQEEADFGLTSQPPSKKLRGVVDFSRPFLHTGIAALASKHSSPDCWKMLLTFLRPFGWPLWIMIASAFGIVFLLMLIFSLCVARAESKKGVEHATSFCDDLYNSLNFTVDAFTPHYIDSYYARSIAGRVISNFWWVFILLVFSAYTSQLVPLLKNGSASHFNPALTNISQLANQNEINYGFARGSIAETYFHALRTNDSLLESIAEKMRLQSHSEPIDSDEEGIGMVRKSNGSFVFFLDSNKADFVNSRAPCDTFRVQGNPLGIRAIGAILPRNSYLKAVLDDAITKLYERGVLDKIHEKWWMKKSNCSHNHRELPVMGTNIYLLNFIGVLAIPAAGITVGFVFAFFEICYRACTRGRRLRQLKRQQLTQEARGETEPGFSDIRGKEDEQLACQPAFTST